jgi:hypothetical protein
MFQQNSVIFSVPGGAEHVSFRATVTLFTKGETGGVNRKEISNVTSIFLIGEHYLIIQACGGDKVREYYVPSVNLLSMEAEYTRSPEMVEKLRAAWLLHNTDEDDTPLA